MTAQKDLVAPLRWGIVDTGGIATRQWFASNAANRLFSPRARRPALLDLGVNPVSFASMVLGTHDRIAAQRESACPGETLAIMDTIDAVRAQGGFAPLADTDTNGRPTTGADER
jgi:hypothetical protein